MFGRVVFYSVVFIYFGGAYSMDPRSRDYSDPKQLIGDLKIYNATNEKLAVQVSSGISGKDSVSKVEYTYYFFTQDGNINPDQTHAFKTFIQSENGCLWGASIVVLLLWEEKHGFHSSFRLKETGLWKISVDAENKFSIVRQGYH